MKGRKGGNFWTPEGNNNRKQKRQSDPSYKVVRAGNAANMGGRGGQLIRREEGPRANKNPWCL